MANDHTPRNKEIAQSIGKFSRSAIYRKRALYKRKKTGVKKDVQPAALFKTKEIGGDKNGQNRKLPVKKEVSILGCKWEL